MDNKIKGCVNMCIISAKIYNEERKIVLFFESENMPSRSEIAETANFWRKKLKADDSITIEIKLKEIEKSKDEKTEDICKKVVDSANASAAPWEDVPAMPAEPEENFYPEYIGPAEEEPNFYPSDYAPMPEEAPEISDDFYADIPTPVEAPVTAMKTADINELNMKRHKKKQSEWLLKMQAVVILTAEAQVVVIHMRLKAKVNIPTKVTENIPKRKSSRLTRERNLKRTLMEIQYI